MTFLGAFRESGVKGEWRCFQDFEEKDDLVSELITKLFVGRPRYTGSASFISAEVHFYSAGVECSGTG